MPQTGNHLDQVKKYGRAYEKNGKLWLAYSGTGIGFAVTGRACSIMLQGDSTAVEADQENNVARYAVYVDGERTQTCVMTEAVREVIVFSGTEIRTARVELIKLSESAMSTLAVTAVVTDGTVSPLPEREHLVEFVGDSITCGYGADTAKADELFRTDNEDVTKAYAWQAADLLHCDRRMISLSGYGVLSGWTGDPEVPSPTQLIPLYYERAGFSYAVSDGEHVQDWPWRFDTREPEIIVLNLGTNDASYTVDDPAKQAAFRERYQAFLAQLRRCNPHARILCVLGVMGDVLYPSVEQAAAAYTQATGDTNLETMHLEAIRPDTEGYAADFHPTVATHTRIAAVVAERLRAMLEKM